MLSHGDLGSIWDAFTYCLSKRVLKGRFLESGLTKIFTVCNFGNTLAMTIIFSFKMFKIWCSIQKWNKNIEKVFRFSDNCIWIKSCKFRQPWRGYLPSAVNVLTKTLRFHVTLGETFSKSTSLRMMKNHDKGASTNIFAGIWDAFTCSLSKRVLKRRFLESGLTKIFTVCNFRNPLAMTIMFFSKMFKLCWTFQKWNKKIKKTFFVFQIIAFILGVANSHKLEHDTCYWQSMCKQTPLRIHLTLEETFSKSTSLGMIKKQDKSALMQISQVFGTLSHIICQSLFWNSAF